MSLINSFAPSWAARPWRALLLAPLLALMLTACQRTASTPATADANPAPAIARTASSPAADEGGTVLYYYDPMRPEVHFDRPGKSPFMDMALLPKYAEPTSGSTPAAGVTVSADVVQNLGIRVAMAMPRDWQPTVRVPARVVADAAHQARLQARVSGWIERLVIRAPGQSVAAGGVIAEIYAPELVQAQEELLLGADTAPAAAERLRRFGIAERDIDAIRHDGHARRRLPLRAPVAGVVTDLGVREGSSVSPETMIADIASRQAVWIEAQLFPAQRLTLGDDVSARFALPGAPGREWRSAAGVLVPVADPTTQTLAMRFAIDAGGELPLGTVLDGELAGAARHGVLMVPASAVIRTPQGDRVLVARSDTRFVPTPVTIGVRDGEWIEITQGLHEHENVVTSGQFLLDAEANLTAGMAAMGDRGAAP